MFYNCQQWYTIYITLLDSKFKFAELWVVKCKNKSSQVNIRYAFFHCKREGGSLTRPYCIIGHNPVVWIITVITKLYWKTRAHHESMSVTFLSRYRFVDVILAGTGVLRGVELLSVDMDTTVSRVIRHSLWLEQTSCTLSSVVCPDVSPDVFVLMHRCL